MTHVLPPVFGQHYPVVVRGEGCSVEDGSGRRYLDAMSGGSMAATLGHGRKDIIEAGRRQARQLSYVHNERLTNPMQEQLATELASVAPNDFTRVKFVTGGSEANETALRVARAYHVERGDVDRWQVVSPAQAYHGPTLETLALTGRPGLHGALAPYLAQHLHIPPCTRQFDPTGEAALAALDDVLERAGPRSVSAFFCEAISAAALPTYTPPRRFWEGLDERRREHGFLVCFDEVVTGMGRTRFMVRGQRDPACPRCDRNGQGPWRRVRGDRGRTRTRPGIPSVRSRVAAVCARSHLGRRAVIVRSGAKGPGGFPRRETVGESGKSRSALAGRARSRAE